MSNPDAATILLIDDHPMLRTGVKQLISMAPELAVIGEAGNGVQGVEMAEALDPDLILAGSTTGARAGGRLSGDGVGRATWTKVAAPWWI